MYEEAQLYSPVTTDDSGEVTVHLAHDHPGANDPEYRLRRNEIAAAALAWNPGEPAPTIAYTEAEQNVWRTVCDELAAKHERYAVREFLEAKERVALPTDHVPGLDQVSARVKPISGWSYVPAAGLVPLEEFYGSLAERRFHSTQYVRHPGVPLYTPEPDIVHEVIGHGHLLATPTFGELHRLAGLAARRLSDRENLLFLSRVFWFSLEFGVVEEDGELRAYGAGILSSYGEIEEFRGMSLRPIDIVEMGTADYDITAYQPVLYRAESIEEIVGVIGWFFGTCDDESIAELRLSRRAAPTRPAASRTAMTPVGGR
ncbi:MAG TPA: phenylalanine 4-monooxygenase [Solirubrobacteraceae bacterium]|jgi:phenylalanine-4-hydroxylase|nr:phenylalanine 4-monooxygenase [Solirubrobacteraceae bacterium]